MALINILSLLQENGLFDRQLQLARGAYLLKAGSSDNHIYYIESGTVSVYILDEDEPRILRFGYPGDIIVALDSLLSGQPTGFTIQALKKTRIRRVPYAAFKNLLRQEPEFQLLWISLLEDLVLQQIEREKDLLIQSPLTRYQRVLKRSPRLFQEIPHKYIASYLRMSPETLSRLQKS
ncbi:Crp/Fnr family transcriptional regulator [Niabella terrae]